jgi:hydroxymethylpyrimidine/phosphomethylpyrimidine kinase
MPVLDEEPGTQRTQSRAGAGCAIAAAVALLLCVGVPLVHPVSFSFGRNGI